MIMKKERIIEERIVFLVIALLMPISLAAQNDKEATFNALRPVIIKYQGTIQMDSTELFNRVFRKYRKDPLTLTRLAGLFYNTENPDSAAAHRVEERISRMYPNFGYVHTCRGANAITYYADHEEGVACMLKGIQLSPDDPQCLAPYVSYRLDKRRKPTRKDSIEVRKMVDNLAARVKKDRDRMRVADLYAMFYGDEHASDASKSLLADITYEEMSLVEIKNILANLMIAGDTERTQELLDDALAKYPADVYLHKIAFTHYNNMHDYEKAERWADIYFAETAPDSLTPRDYRMYAACLNERKAYSEALENLWKAYETADAKMEVDAAYSSKLLDGKMIIDTSQSIAEDCLKAGNAEKAADIFREAIDRFLRHNDTYQARNSYYELADMYRRSAETLEGEAKAEAFIKARTVYKEIEDRIETEQANKDLCFFYQWLMTRNALLVDRENFKERYNVIPYAEELFNRGLAKDTPNEDYLYNPIVDIQLFSDKPERVPEYIERVYNRFPDFESQKIDKLKAGSTN